MAKRPQPRTTNETAPAAIDLEVNADEFACADYEALTNWSTGNSDLSITQIFDILDRVIVGGFRQRRFVDVRKIIQTMLAQLSDIATGEPKN